MATLLNETKGQIHKAHPINSTIIHTPHCRHLSRDFFWKHLSHNDTVHVRCVKCLHIQISQTVSAILTCEVNCHLSSSNFFCKTVSSSSANVVVFAIICVAMPSLSKASAISRCRSCSPVSLPSSNVVCCNSSWWYSSLIWARSSGEKGCQAKNMIFNRTFFCLITMTAGITSRQSPLSITPCSNAFFLTHSPRAITPALCGHASAVCGRMKPKPPLNLYGGQLCKNYRARAWSAPMLY